MSLSKLEVVSYEPLGKLPDLFRFEDGREVKTLEDWKERRQELYRSAVELQYGTMPPEPEFLEVEPLFYNYHAELVFRVHTGTRAHPVSFRMQICFPKGVEGKREVLDHYEGPRFPVLINGDGSFISCFENRAHLLSNGIGYVVFDRTELAHDIKGEGRRKGPLYETYPDYTFGAIGAWAWGYSRCVDALLKLDMIEPEHIAFAGHSRGAKTAAIAGILDERASFVNPHQTCAGGCGCYRVHMEAVDDEGVLRRSERLSDIWANFGFWFGEGMGEYAEREQELPFDSHFIKALIAPRVLYVSEGTHDVWANPIGSWQTTMAAGEAYRFLGAEDKLFWSFRDGVHVRTAEDMERLGRLLRHVWYGEPLPDGLFETPFDEPELLFDRKEF